MMPFPPELRARYRAEGAWGDRTIHDVFAAHAASSPGRMAVVDAPNRAQFAEGAARRLTYAALAAMVERLAATLWLAGLRRGDVMLVQMPNQHELVALYLAAARLGIIVSPVPVQYRQGEIVPIVRAARPRAFCGTARAVRSHPIALFRDHVAREAGFDGLIMGFGESLPEGTLDLAQAMAAVPDPAAVLAAAPPACPDELFSICWTSGTEGRPKGVPKTHNNWLCSAPNARLRGWLPEGGAMLAPFPLVNAAAIGGLLMSWLGAGGTLVLHHPFDLDVFLAQIADEQVVYTIAAPALLASIAERLARGGMPAIPSLRAIGTGSAPVDPALLARIEAALPVQVINIFGSNEGLQLCSDRGATPDPERRARTFPRHGDQDWRPGSTTANGVSFRLLHPMEDRPVTGPGEAGEMAIQGPSVFPGYLGEAEGTRPGFTPDGYFRTGDLFEALGDAIRFVGRQKELIVRGGMKIAPAELDALIARHPAVREAAVAAWADPRLGEKVCAFVVLRPGQALALGELGEFLERQGTARFKWPERLVVLDALPRNALAKVERRRLSEMAGDLKPHTA